jgi:hypothetical protein
MFDSTIPFGEPELMRASRYRQYLPGQLGGYSNSVMSETLATLSPSLVADLRRVEFDQRRFEPLDVLTACLRHAQAVTVHLQCGDRAVPLTVFPRERQLHCPMAIVDLLQQRKPDLQVMHVEPALMRPLTESDVGPGRAGESSFPDLGFYPLGPMLWELALNGSRCELLPEIAGPAVYRVSLGFELGGMQLSGTLMSAVYRLRRGSCQLRDIAAWPGLDRERAERLLNALYLQSGLIVSRSHPDIVGESWFGGLGR